MVCVAHVSVGDWADPPRMWWVSPARPQTLRASNPPLNRPITTRTTPPPRAGKPTTELLVLLRRIMPRPSSTLPFDAELAVRGSCVNVLTATAAQREYRLTKQDVDAVLRVRVT